MVVSIKNKMLNKVDGELSVKLMRGFYFHKMELSLVLVSDQKRSGIDLKVVFI